MVPPLRGGTRGGGQQSIGGGMARDGFATFNNYKFKPYNTFKMNCVGYNQSKGLVESIYNRDLSLLVSIWTL